MTVSEHQRNVATGVVGDFNQSKEWVDALAKAIGAPRSWGIGVDRGLFRGCVVEKCLILDRHGSDHPALLFVLRLRSGDIVRVLSWNVMVSQRPLDVRREVCTLVDAHQPHVVCLYEAYQLRDVLDRDQVPGYTRFQGRRGRKASEGAEIACLVRRDITVVHSGWVRMSQKWDGPKHGLRHDGRHFVRLRLRFPKGGVLRLLAVHGPFGTAAVREMWDRIIRWSGVR